MANLDCRSKIIPLAFRDAERSSPAPEEKLRPAFLFFARTGIDHGLNAVAMFAEEISMFVR
jgi:hypothetical protein